MDFHHKAEVSTKNEFPASLERCLELSPLETKRYSEKLRWAVFTLKRDVTATVGPDVDVRFFF